jgi:hypothetical protein
MKTERNLSSTGEVLRNLTGIIPGNTCRRARVWPAQATRQSSRLSAISSKKRAPEDVICQRFPVPNPNPSSHIPLSSADFPNLKNFAVFYW